MLVFSRKGCVILNYCDLDTLLDVIQRGTNLHISVVFSNGIAAGKLHCNMKHVRHSKPICLYFKQKQRGLSKCIRCRLAVQKAVLRHNRVIAGYCVNGVYEYCSPVIWHDKVIAVIFIGNIFTGDQKQLTRMGELSCSPLQKTMETDFSYDDCVNTANIISSHILLLADRYGIEQPNQDALVENMKDFINSNYAEDFYADDLAAKFGYNPKYLGRLFKANAGYTIREYCNRIRISAAKELLENTQMKIADIAQHVGYNNITYFNYVFAALVGVSPSEYRNAYGNTEHE